MNLIPWQTIVKTGRKLSESPNLDDYERVCEDFSWTQREVNYDFGNHKYRGPIPEAPTRYEAEQAEIKLKRDVFDGKYGRRFGTMSFVGDPNAANEQFGEGTFLDWARRNKRSWKHDADDRRLLSAPAHVRASS